MYFVNELWEYPSYMQNKYEDKSPDIEQQPPFVDRK